VLISPSDFYDWVRMPDSWEISIAYYSLYYHTALLLNDQFTILYDHNALLLLNNDQFTILSHCTIIKYDKFSILYYHTAVTALLLNLTTYIFTLHY